MRAEACTPDKRPLVCQYMTEKIGVYFDPNACQAFAVLDDSGDFVAAVVVSNMRMHNGKPIDCEISCAAEYSVAWQPEVCRVVFGYIFNQLGCVRCTSTTKKNNTRARGFLDALNFKLEGHLRKAYDGEKDALVYGLLAEDCHFLEGLNG